MFALPVYARLTIALMDRLAAGDSVRASILTQKMAAIWPDMKSAFASEVQAQGGVPSGTTWPAALPATWTGDTQTIGVLSLQRQVAAGTPLYTAAANLYDVPAPSMVARAQAVLATVPAGASGREYVAISSSASPGDLPRNLDAMIAGTVALSAVPPLTQAASSSSGSSTQTTAPIVPRPSTSTPIQLPGMTITGSSPTPSSSNWGWWALGGVVAIGLGVYAYQKIAGASS